jgi:hypothetical protein
VPTSIAVVFAAIMSVIVAAWAFISKLLKKNPESLYSAGFCGIRLDNI